MKTTLIGLDVLGDTLPELPHNARFDRAIRKERLIAGLIGAIFGYTLGERYAHPVLGTIGGLSVGFNGADLVSGEDDRLLAIERIGRTGAGILGALVIHRYPVVGFAAGEIAATIALPVIRSEALEAAGRDS